MRMRFPAFLAAMLACMAWMFAQSSTAHAAQTKKASPDFCNLSPNEMLAALDGTWSFSQGQTIVLNAALPLILPPKRAVGLKLKYFGGGYSILSGQGEEMLMIGGDKEDLGSLAKFLTEQEAEGLVKKAGKGCSWDNAPIMVGSTAYSLEHKPSKNDRAMQVYGLILPGDFVVCRYSDGSYKTAKEYTWGQSAFLHNDRPECDEMGRQYNGSGDMIMSMILKFESPFSGTGVLMFKGKSGKHSFFAKAPLTFSR